MTRELRQVCEAAIELGAGFPEPDPDAASAMGEWLTLHWNASFARAAARLAQTAIKMCDLRMLEVSLITRAMMELAVDQGLLNTDPKLAIRYSLEMQSGNEQLIARMDEYGTGTSDEGAEKAAQVEEVAAQLRSMGFDEWPTSSYPPLGKNARDRFEAAGMAKYYETFYYTDSDLAHMSARAVQRYLDGDFDDDKVQNDLTRATDMLLRVLISANEKNDTGLDEKTRRAGRCVRSSGFTRSALTFEDDEESEGSP